MHDGIGHMVHPQGRQPPRADPLGRHPPGQTHPQEETRKTSPQEENRKTPPGRNQEDPPQEEIRKTPLQIQESYNLTAETHFYSPQRSWGKVIFLEACVKNSVSRPTPRGEVMGSGQGVSRSTPKGGAVSQHALRQTLPPPPQPGGYCSGRYASYWNAFLYYVQTKLD